MKSVLENIYPSKDLSYQIPWSKSASLHPELPQGLLKVNSSSLGSVSAEADGKCPCCCCLVSSH